MPNAAPSCTAHAREASEDSLSRTQGALGAVVAAELIWKSVLITSTLFAELVLVRSTKPKAAIAAVSKELVLPRTPIWI